MITARARVLDRIADHLAQRSAGHPPRTAVDGITAAGKTTFAREPSAMGHAVFNNYMETKTVITDLT